MGPTDKKREPLDRRQGRPRTGAMSTYDASIVSQIKYLRELHPAWGAISIRVELEHEYGFSSSDLPSVPTIDRYLKEQGFIQSKEPKTHLPSSSNCHKAKLRVHQCWEMDAQGAIAINSIGYHALINIKDRKSKVHCMSFPVKRKHSKSQPRTVFYYWALRLAFEEWGLPKQIRVDRDSVFVENTTRSPFPTKLHLWLIGLGIELCFIKRKPPIENAIIERSHQTMEKQIRSSKPYRCWKELFKACEKRRKVLNEKMPNRMLGKQAPLQAFPQAKQSKRNYQVQQEDQLIDFKRIHAYLAKCQWYRKVSNVKTISSCLSSMACILKRIW